MITELTITKNNVECLGSAEQILKQVDFKNNEIAFEILTDAIKQLQKLKRMEENYLTKGL